MLLQVLKNFTDTDIGPFLRFNRGSLSKNTMFRLITLTHSQTLLLLNIEIKWSETDNPGLTLSLTHFA